jgi:hypothetical protein
MVKVIFMALLVFPGMAAAELLLFGGSGHDEFLGCFNCSKFDSDSICNEYGTYGSRYNTNSIWNPYGTFGSMYNSSSPWNKYSSSKDVPVIVDRDGEFYGYFTINSYRSDAFSASRSLKELFEKLDNLEKVREVFCD